MDKTKVCVYFRILGDDFNPSEITDIMMLAPSYQWRNGDLIPGLDRARTYSKDRVRTYSSWAISTGYQESLDTNTQLKQITDLIEDKRDMLAELAKVKSLEYRFEIVAKIYGHQTPGITIENDIIGLANTIGAIFDIDLYVSD